MSQWKFLRGIFFSYCFTTIHPSIHLWNQGRGACWSHDLTRPHINESKLAKLINFCIAWITWVAFVPSQPHPTPETPVDPTFIPNALHSSTGSTRQLKHSCCSLIQPNDISLSYIYTLIWYLSGRDASARCCYYFHHLVCFQKLPKYRINRTYVS